MKPSAISNVFAKFFAALLLLSLGLAAAPAMALPGFAYAITDGGQNKADPGLGQNVTVVRIGSLTKRQPRYENWSTNIVSLKTPQGVEVVSLFSSPVANCPADPQQNCRQDHVLTLNAFRCSLKGEYVATFEQWMTYDKGIYSRQESVPFTLGGGGECAPGESRTTLAAARAAADAAAKAAADAAAAKIAALLGGATEAAKRAMQEPPRFVQLKIFVFQPPRECLRAMDSAVGTDYCDTFGSQWRYEGNQLWATTSSDARCLVGETDTSTGIVNFLVSQDCATRQTGNIRRLAHWTLEQLPGQKFSNFVAMDIVNVRLGNGRMCVGQDSGKWRLYDCNYIATPWVVETLLGMPKYDKLQQPAILWHDDGKIAASCVIAGVPRNANLVNPTALAVYMGGAACTFDANMMMKYFQREDAGGGFFRLRYASSNLCVAATGNTENSSVVLRLCSNEAGQKWQQSGKRLQSAVALPPAPPVLGVIAVLSNPSAGNSAVALCLARSGMSALVISRCRDMEQTQYFSVITDTRGAFVQTSPAITY